LLVVEINSVHTSLIVCIGNDLVADDGVGYAVYDALIGTLLPEGTRVKLLGLGGMDLLEQMAGEPHLIVVDAVQFGTDPGTIHVLDWDQLPAMEARPVSGHGIGVREAIEVAKRIYPEKVPQKIHLVGVEGECFDQLGKGLTPTVSSAIPKAVETIVSLL